MRRRCGSFAWNSFVAAKNTSDASFCGCICNKHMQEGYEFEYDLTQGVFI
jgi:hypothetical protein